MCLGFGDGVYESIAQENRLARRKAFFFVGPSIYGSASSQWCANPWKRRPAKFNGVSMTVQQASVVAGRGGG